MFHPLGLISNSSIFVSSIKRAMNYAYSLLSIYKEIKSLIWSEEDVIIDSIATRLSYKTLTSFLIFSSVLVTFHSWVGASKPIYCRTSYDDTPSFIDDFCWIHPKELSLSEESWSQEKINKQVEGLWGKTDYRSHYYEWTPFFFLFQALSFYVTRFIWRRWENGTVSYFKKTLSVKELDDDQRADIASEMIIERSIKGFNKVYSFGYTFSEFLCLMNIIFQFIITTRFLGTIETSWTGTINFVSLGWSVIKNMDSRPWQPLRMMFPRQAKCPPFEYIGRGGGPVRTPANCLLPLSIIHEKVERPTVMYLYKLQISFRFFCVFGC